MIYTLIGTPGPWELVLIVLVIVLLFGAKKLPELARGSGRALRIFKSETKGLMDDDDDKSEKATADSTDMSDDSTLTPAQRELHARQTESDRSAREQRDGTTS